MLKESGNKGEGYQDCQDQRGDILRPFVESYPKGKQLDRKAVDELKQYRLEIRQNHPGEIFEDSVDLIRQAREDRTRELEQR